MGKRELFWVRMRDVQEALGVTNMSDLVRKDIHGIFETKNPTKDQIKTYKKRKKELGNERNFTFVYICSDLMSRIIKKILEVKKEEVEKKEMKRWF